MRLSLYTAIVLALGVINFWKKPNDIIGYLAFTTVLIVLLVLKSLKNIKTKYTMRMVGKYKNELAVCATIFLTAFVLERLFNKEYIIWASAVLVLIIAIDRVYFAISMEYIKRTDIFLEARIASFLYVIVSASVFYFIRGILPFIFGRYFVGFFVIAYSALFFAEKMQIKKCKSIGKTLVFNKYRQPIRLIEMNKHK